MKYFALVAALLLASGVYGITWPKMSQKLTDNFTIYWEYVGSDSIKIGYQWKYFGWVGIALGAGMPNHDIMACETGTDGKLAMTDLFATAYAKPGTDVAQGGTQDLTLLEQEISNGVKSVVFQRKLNTGDSKDTVINTTPLTISWAGSPDNTLTYHGTTRGRVENFAFSANKFGKILFSAATLIVAAFALLF
jgi:hypothetical protein